MGTMRHPLYGTGSGSGGDGSVLLHTCVTPAPDSTDIPGRDLRVGVYLAVDKFSIYWTDGLVGDGHLEQGVHRSD